MTKLLGAHMIHMGYLLYSTQETSTKEDNVDAVPKI
jgi:hypothetical protein